MKPVVRAMSTCWLLLLFAWLPTPADEVEFLESSVCSQCHSNAEGARAMRDSAGAGISPFDLWSPTMMGNSARDPFWRAVVSMEVAATPSKRAEIEATCMRCHAPMVRATAESGDGSPISVLDDAEREGHGLARDGASCTVCHQIEDKRFGTPESFSGGFVIGTEGKIFGPHQGVNPMPMRHHTGYTPTFSAHVNESAMCATCHTLFTEALAADGRAVGSTLPEQTPYLEWRNSKFNNEGREANGGASCQDCHLPTDDEQGKAIRTAIARNPHGSDFGFAGVRSPFGRHEIIGGNMQVPSMLANLAHEGGASVAPERLETTAWLARRQLEQQTGTIEIGMPMRQGETLRVPVTVHNLAGHKFPSAHPSRRAWIRFVVRSPEGEVLFASGSFDRRGRLVAGDGTLLTSELAGGPFQLHRNVVRGEAEAAVYESVMADSRGEPTYLLIRGAQYKKDNRLLPAGWRDDHPDAATIAPVGLGEDTDFVGGADTVVYHFRAPREKGPYTFEADWFYQPLGARYVTEVLQFDTPEVERFRKAYAAIDHTPARIATARRTTDPEPTKTD